MLCKTSSGEPCALVSNIQKYTIHDGPGIRTAVFFTGCTMRCLWCSNPETIEPRTRLGTYPAKCLTYDKCGFCVRSCPATDGDSSGMLYKSETASEIASEIASETASGSASGSASNAANETASIPAKNTQPIEFGENGALRSIKMTAKCEGCLKCAGICPPRAIKAWGERMTLAELMKIIMEDIKYYERTGGGVTLSGGEVMLQWEFARSLLKACREASVNTCVETALNCPIGHMEAVYEYADLVIADIKHMDTDKHKEYTGAGNEQILANLKRTVELGKKLIVRTPVVPGYNGDEENIAKTGAFIRDELGGAVIQYQLLPYRKLGIEKYASLSLPYPLGDYQPPDRADWEPAIARLAAMLTEKYSIPATAGASTLQRREQAPALVP